MSTNVFSGAGGGYRFIAACRQKRSVRGRALRGRLVRWIGCVRPMRRKQYWLRSFLDSKRRYDDENEDANADIDFSGDSAQRLRASATVSVGVRW